VGEEYTHDQLFTALFLPSANDAAGALARANGSMTTTLSQMNAEAQRLGALDTVAKNPSGLDAEGQRSSAYDLALIAREGLKNTTFARYASMVTADFPGKAYSSGKRATFEIQTQNRLLSDGYPGAIGVKTGFTTNAGRTFVGAAKRGDRTLIVSLMGISEPTEDAARKLLDWGFVNQGRITAPVGTLVEPQPVAAKPQEQAGQAQQIDEAGSSAGVGGAGGPGPLTLGITGLAIVAGAAMIVVAVLNSDAVTRRRIRRRYR
jgi:D-alanyl-D-alanine carboxypeptidase (penicillin-binding protein 5/6)